MMRYRRWWLFLGAAFLLGGASDVVNSARAWADVEPESGLELEGDDEDAVHDIEKLTQQVPALGKNHEQKDCVTPDSKRPPISEGGNPRSVHRGLIYSGLTGCRVDPSSKGFDVGYRQLHQRLGGDTQLRVVRNEGLTLTGGYGGTNLNELVQYPAKYKVYAAVNGTIFGNYPETTKMGYPGPRSRGLIWDGEKVLSPLRKGGGTSIVLWDKDGKSHVLEVQVKCSKKAPCSIQVNLSKSWIQRPGADLKGIAQAKSWEEWLVQLKKVFPGKFTLLQLNMPAVKDGFQCKTASPEAQAGGEDSARGDWKCKKAARTLLCLHEDHSTSVIVTNPILPGKIWPAFSVAGKCNTGCVKLFNMDGGGSTQMGLKTRDGFSMRTGASPRPVDHYLMFTSPDR